MSDLTRSIVIGVIACLAIGATASILRLALGVQIPDFVGGAVAGGVLAYFIVSAMNRRNGS